MRLIGSCSARTLFWQTLPLGGGRLEFRKGRYRPKLAEFQVMACDHTSCPACPHVGLSCTPAQKQQLDPQGPSQGPLCQAIGKAWVPTRAP